MTNGVIYLPVDVKGATGVGGKNDDNVRRGLTTNTTQCPMLLYNCWASVDDSVLTLPQHCVSFDIPLVGKA